MIVSPAVKVYDKKQGKTLILPCHSYSDIPAIFNAFGYYEAIYHILEKGFIDQNNRFYDKLAAYTEAWQCKQVPRNEGPYESKYLFPDDLQKQQYNDGFRAGYAKSLETINYLNNTIKVLHGDLLETHDEYMASLRYS